MSLRLSLLHFPFVRNERFSPTNLQYPDLQFPPLVHSDPKLNRYQLPRNVSLSRAMDVLLTSKLVTQSEAPWIYADYY